MSDDKDTAVERYSATTGLQPRTLKEANQFAGMLAKSGLLPEALRNKPADVLVVLLTGHRYNLDPMQSINAINVIHGKPVMSADLIRALCMASPVCEYFDLIHSDANKATYEAKRVGRPAVTMSYTIEEARKAGLFERRASLWPKYPADLLRHRCKARIAREVFSDVVLGVYIPDEAADIASSAPEPRRATVVQATAEPVDPPKDKPKRKAKPKADAAPEVAAEPVDTPPPVPDGDPFAALDPAKAGW